MILNRMNNLLPLTMQPRIAACFWLLAFPILMQAVNSKVCKSINVRNNVSSLEQLNNCTVVEGFLKIALIEKEFVEADFEPYTFPKLGEITGYLMFYRVSGLRSLGKLFPNLQRIRGDDVIYDFSLVVFEMSSLQEIGLINLREISKGSVIIAKNPNLCFVDTVMWSKITRYVVKNYYYKNRQPANCPGCPDTCRDNACWNATYCQKGDEEFVECHPMCLGGCFEPGPGGCYSCRGFFDLDGNCVEKCPPNTYTILDRRCVTREGCFEEGRIARQNAYDMGILPITIENMTNVTYVIHGNRCLESCPSGFEPDPRGKDCTPCKDGFCQVWCRGAVINSTGDARELRSCTHISGSIEITIKSETSRAIHSVLEENLGSIEEITGYLKVTRSSVTDLNFLKNLTMIHGNDSSNKNFALFVLDNENLQELWDWNIKKNFSVVNGRLFFHYNPKLCLQHIYKLLDVIRYQKNFSNFEIGKQSNGDRFPCNALNINITVTYRSVDTIEIHVPYMETNNTVPVLRYVIFYTKDPYNNITMFDDLDQCSDYGWKTKDFSVVDPNDSYYKAHGFRVNLTELEPDTVYVFYVTTYTIYSVSARSGMKSNKTFPSTPSELTRLNGFSNSSSEITLQWEPPKQIRGELESYVVTWYMLKEDRAFIDQRNYCGYPMIHATDNEESEIEQLEVKVSNNSCCSTYRQIKHIPKEGFEVLCDDFENVRLPFGFPDKTKFSSCESYFYTYIYSSPFHDRYRAKIKDPSVYEAPMSNNIVHNINKKNIETKNLLTFQKKISSAEPNLKNIIKKEIKRLPPDLFGTVLRNLRHYQKYVISVKACRKFHPQDQDISEDRRCSRSEMLTIRTKENQDADRIKQNDFHVKVTKEAIIVRWKAPENPNGLIVAFDIEYQHSDLENRKYISDCLTFNQFISNNNQHIIEGLPPGRYAIRVRAVSLFGKGPFSPFKDFNVGDKTLSQLKGLLIFVVVMVVLVLILFISHYASLHKYQVNHTLIPDVNPNYHYIPDDYEIDRDDVEFLRELGIGSFGKVYEGFLKSRDLRCAIKTVNEHATVDNENEFLSEVTIMKSMTSAHFIVKLLGVVSRGRPPLALMELMDLGDLKTYLRSMREIHPITNATMIKMATEIADAMAFMEGKKFVHRDLAARNCMVNSDLTIKVGDFGMARDIYETDYYRKRNKGFLPIRWMAPESLRDGEFTSRSDIWSYGVVLWEIVTMAEQPYQGSSNDEVLHQVINGRRLEIPKNCPLPLRSLMTTCWRTNPPKRSSFMSIVGSLEYYHDDDFKMAAYYYSTEAEAVRKSMWEYVEMQPVEDPISEKINGILQIKNFPRSTYFSLATVDEEKVN